MSGLSDNWDVFGGELLEETVFNIRFIKDDGGPAINKIFHGKDFPNIEQLKGALESTIQKINNQGYKAYANLNPINPDFDGYAAKDKDILKRARLLVDIDSKSDTRQPATEEEVDQALTLAHAIVGFTTNEGWALPHIIDSGNGVHLIYELEGVANTPEDRELIKKTLYQLDYLFSNETHKVDTSVHNAGRISKLVGTKAYKGKATDERPVRTSSLIQSFKGKTTRNQLKDFCDGFESKEPDLKVNGSAVPPQAPVKLEGLEAALNQPLFEKSLQQERADLRNALKHLSPKAKHGVGTFEDGQYWSAVIIAIASLGDDFRDIALEWSDQEGANFSIEAFNKAWDSYDPDATGYEGKKKTIASLYGYVNQITGKGKNITKFGQLGDIANGERFANTFKDQIIFVRDTDDAFIFVKEKGWIKAESDAQIKAAKMIAEEMGRKAIKWKQDDPDSKPAQLAINEAVRTSKKNGLESMLWCARSVDGMSVNADQLDQEHHLLGVQNGIVNLDTGELLAPDPTILVTKRANVTYDPDAKCPRYCQFLKECIPDKDQIEFFVRWNGYRLSGFTTEQKYIFMKGRGGNGKTKELELSVFMLGDYASKFKTQILINDDRNPQGHDADLMFFQGLRFGYCNETSENKYLNEQMVKELVDEGTLSGRVPYGKKQINFLITSKIQIAGNHAPIIRGTDDGIWRRTIIFDWPIKFLDRDDPEAGEGPFRDRDLLPKLKAEASGILNLWLKGYQAWKKGGLQIPKSLIHATNVFRDENDLLGQWLEDCCTVGQGLSESKARLYHNYTRWAENCGYHPLTQNSFSRSLRERGYLIASDKRTIKGLANKNFSSGGLTE